MTNILLCFSGCYRHDSPSVALEKYFNDAKAIINAQIKSGRRVSFMYTKNETESL